MSPRVWRAGGLVAAALILAAAWLLLINPTLRSAAALQDQTVSQEQAADELRSRISLLKKQSEELPAQEALLAQIQQRMPPTSALPTLIRNLTTVSKRANVIVASVTPGRPTPVEQPLPAPASTAPDETDAAPESDSPEQASRPAAPAPTGPQVESMSINITACGTFAQLRNYLRELESMKRVMAVSALSVARGSCAPASPEDDLTATIGAHVFTLPNASAPTAQVDTDAEPEPKATKKTRAKKGQRDE